MATTLLTTQEIRFDPNFLADSHALYAQLVEAIPWDDRIRARKAMSFGWPYNYSGIEWPATPFPAVLVPLLEHVSRFLGWTPNNCLAHYYPDGRSTMGFHMDETTDLADTTGIAIVSLGAMRVLTFRHERNRERLEHYTLTTGSLLVMSLAMQTEWKHAILATNQDRGRISLTFRRMKAENETYGSRNVDV